MQQRIAEYDRANASLHAAHEHYLHQKYCDREMRDPICADIAEERRAGADRIAAEQKKQEAYRADAKRREDDKFYAVKKTVFGQMLAHPEYYCEGGTLNTETFKCEK